MTHRQYAAALIATLVMLAGCGKQPAGPPPESKAVSQGERANTSTVIETMNSGGYTYALVEAAGEKAWVAAPEFQVKVGDKVVVPAGMPMTDFKSKTLDRTFDLIYFVSAVSVMGSNQPAGPHSGMSGAMTSPSSQEELDFSGISKPAGGLSVAELYARKTELSAKKVIVRGKVVKASSNIMGKNWLHLQDGTGTTGTDDLTITSSQIASRGDTIVATGTLTVDKDFGSGYRYDLIMEDATIELE